MKMNESIQITSLSALDKLIGFANNTLNVSTRPTTYFEFLRVGDLRYY
ncbi:MAG: hypothetical protein ABIS36_03765 [Chryseolinea sp.]